MCKELQLTCTAIGLLIKPLNPERKKVAVSKTGEAKGSFKLLFATEVEAGHETASSFAFIVAVEYFWRQIDYC